LRSLVTGGAGFIGSHLADALIARDHEVLVLDNLVSGKKENINPQATLQVVDICDQKAVEAAVHDFSPRFIHHYAAQIDARLSVENPSYDALVNIVGSINVIRAAMSAKAEKFIFISSGGAIYGEPNSLPVKEDHPVNPLSPYGLSKFAVEKYLDMMHRLTGLSYVCLRYANIYGPRQDPLGEAGVFAIFAQAMLSGKPPAIFGDGTATRDYLFVSDAVHSNLLAMNDVPVGSYNIGSGAETSVNEVYKMLAEPLAFKQNPQYSPPKLGEVNHISLDCENARLHLNWEPKVSLKEGISLLLQSLSH
jgi:UDP-glucose 4-epimerase